MIYFASAAVLLISSLLVFVYFKNRINKNINVETSRNQDVAIVGMAFELPIGNDVEEVFRNLSDQKTYFDYIPSSRWVSSQNESDRGAFVPTFENFDYSFFGISKVEAERIDPVQRKLLELSWKALEDACIKPSTLSGTDTSVIVGVGNSGYEKRYAGKIEGFNSTSNVASIAPNRLSYFLNLKGLSYPVETACSSSLVAIHRASQLLINGDSKIAITGGLNILADQDQFNSFKEAGMLSPTGECRPFSTDSNGYVRGEGAGIFILKRLNDALADKDNVYAIIKSTGENHGGKSNTLTSPNPKAQSDLIKKAIKDSNINIDQLAFVEAHGTGTKLGDPIEIKSLHEAISEFKSESDERKQVLVGSIKSNIGHLEVAAGAAGLVKSIIQLNKRVFLPTANIGEHSKYLKLDHKCVSIPMDVLPLDGMGKPIAGGISSFGFGGVNSHLVLEEFRGDVIAENQHYERVILPLSAKSVASLQRYCVELYEWLDPKCSIGDIAHTLQHGRDDFDKRCCLIVSDIEDLKTQLNNIVHAGIGNYRWFNDTSVGKISNSVIDELSDEELLIGLRKWIGTGDYEQIAKVWLAGTNLDWNSVYPRMGRTVSLPTYQFENNRVWFDDQERSIGYLTKCSLSSGRQDIASADLSEIRSLVTECHNLADETYQNILQSDHQNVSLVTKPSLMTSIAPFVECINKTTGHGYVTFNNTNLESTWHFQDTLGITPRSNMGVSINVDTILVTGGTGSIGIHLSERLANLFPKVDVIIVSRNETKSNHPKLLKLVARSKNIRQETVDISNAEDVRKLVSGLSDRKIGVVHAAGILSDGPVDLETAKKLEDTLATKTYGLLNLLESDHENSIDFVISLTSVASMLSNIGQANYVLANHLVDQISELYNGPKSPRLVSVSLPHIQEGNMALPEATLERYKSSGLVNVPVSSVVEAVVELVTRADSIGHYVMHTKQHEDIALIKGRVESNTFAMPNLTQSDSEDLKSALIDIISSSLKLEGFSLTGDSKFRDLNIDSIMTKSLTKSLHDRYSCIKDTTLFEVETVNDLFQYVIDNQKEIATTAITVARNEPVTEPVTVSLARSTDDIIPSNDIAIIGMAGEYADAKNLEEYWSNLLAERCSISTIPQERWTVDNAFIGEVDDAIKCSQSYSKWGGFLTSFSQFEPQHFRISNKEAWNIDPQERILLRNVWQAVEDSGYKLDVLNKGNVGVYVGVTKSGFEHNLYQDNIKEGWMPLTSFGSCANRLSSFFNFKGPSLAIDTMCSSSLVAVSNACKALIDGECDVAIAGGVNLYLNEYNYKQLSSKKMLSPNGVCSAFGHEANGFVPGEGVGSVILKPLSKAIEDNDNIHAVIKGTAVNHGGTTRGYTVPSPISQSEVIVRAIKAAGIRSNQISLLEAHGTGTELGDPIEVSGIEKAFEATRELGTPSLKCNIGSVKPNIGHLEAASGIASLHKLVLQLKNKRIAKSLNASSINPKIDIDREKFDIANVGGMWLPEDADGNQSNEYYGGVSSFGAGGTNAHCVVANYTPQYCDISLSGSYPFIISAKNIDLLMLTLDAYVNYLKGLDAKSQQFLSISKTLWEARERYAVHVVVYATSFIDLINKLSHVSKPKDNSTTFVGSASEEIELAVSERINDASVPWPIECLIHLPKMSLPVTLFNETEFWIKRELPVSREIDKLLVKDEIGTPPNVGLLAELPRAKSTDETVLKVDRNRHVEKSVSSNVADPLEQIKRLTKTKGLVPTLNRTGVMVEENGYYSQKFIEYAASVNSCRVLDIGCAYGVASIEALGVGADVVAVDVEKEHLNILEQRVGERLRNKLTVLQGLIQDIRFEDEYFDAIHAGRVMHFLSPMEIRSALISFYKWLKPGGKIFITSDSPFFGYWSSKTGEYLERKKSGDKWPGYISNVHDVFDKKYVKGAPPTINPLDPDVLQREVTKVGYLHEESGFFDAGELTKGHLDHPYAGKEHCGVIAKKPDTAISYGLFLNQHPILSFTYDSANYYYQQIGSGEKTLVFLHGLGCDRNVWEQQYKHIDTKAFKILSLDLPGHGLNRNSGNALWSYQYCGDVVCALLDAVKAKQVVLVGHSFGGLINLYIDSQRPTLVEKIVNVESMHNLDSQVSTKRISQDQYDRYVDYMLGTSQTEFGLKPYLLGASDLVSIDLINIGMEEMARYKFLPERREKLTLINSSSWVRTSEEIMNNDDIDVHLVNAVTHFPQVEKFIEVNRILQNVVSDQNAVKE